MEDAPVPTPRTRGRDPNRLPRAPSPPPEYSTLSFLTSPEEAVRAEEFHRLYKAAYSATVLAQNLDADGLNEEAFKGYEKALQLIDDTVTAAHKGGFSAQDVNRIDELTLKIRMTRKEILERLSDLQGNAFANASQEYLQGPSGAHQRPQDLPPAYSEAAIMSSPVASPYNNLSTVLDEIASQEGASANPLPINAHEIFSIPENVQIYFISAEDNVSAPTYPSFLRVVVMEGGERGIASSVPAFLQVGDWTYPLIPNHSPVFRSTEGIYMFPDLTATVPGSYVGLLLPTDVSPEVRLSFEEALLQLLGIQRFPLEAVTPESPKERKKTPPEIPPRPVFPAPGAAGPAEAPPIPAERRLSTKIAEGLITGAEAVSRGLLFGATKTSHYLDKGAAYLQSKIEPAKERSNIKPEYRKGMKTAKNVTGKAVQVSGYVVSQVGRATLSLGRQLAPHVHKAGTKLLARTVATDETDASGKVDQVIEVTAGAVYGFGTVYMGFENAAKVLANSLANNTVQIVQHRHNKLILKYGDEAGEFATDTAAAAGNTAMTAWNAKSLAPKAVAKRMAKDTGKMVLESHAEKKNNNGGSSPKDSGPENGDDAPPKV